MSSSPLTAWESRRARAAAHVAALSSRSEQLRRRSRYLAARSQGAMRSPLWRSEPQVQRNDVVAHAYKVRSVAMLLCYVAEELRGRAALAVHARGRRAP